MVGAPNGWSGTRCSGSRFCASSSTSWQIGAATAPPSPPDAPPCSTTTAQTARRRDERREADEQRVIAVFPRHALAGQVAMLALGLAVVMNLRRAGLARQQHGRILNPRAIGRAVRRVDDIEHAAAEPAEMYFLHADRAEIGIDAGRQRARWRHDTLLAREMRQHQHGRSRAARYTSRVAAASPRRSSGQYRS